MNEPQTMPELIDRIERAIGRVKQAIAPLSPAQLQEPRLDGGRSIKDTLAHLAWWDQWLLMTLPADQAGPGAPIALPLADQIPATGSWAEELNAKTFDHNQSRELAEVQAEFAATCARLMQRVSQLSLDDLYQPERLSAAIGQPAAPLVLGIYEHYEEHAHELEQLVW